MGCILGKTKGNSEMECINDPFCLPMTINSDPSNILIPTYYNKESSDPDCGYDIALIGLTKENKD